MKKRFSKIYIEISNLCNLQCTFCPEVIRDKKILNINNFKKIVDSIEPYTDLITLHLMGEPLLHPHFSEIIEILNATNLKLDLTSNAILLEKHQALILKSPSIRQINFSVQSFVDNFPEKPIETYLEKLLTFSQLAKTERPDLFINFRLWNLGNTDGGYSLQNNSVILDFFSKHFNVDFPTTLDVKSKKSWKLTDKIRIHWDTRFDWPSLTQPSLGSKGFCYGLKSQIGIHADGTVVPCCLDKEAIINLGNILTEPLPKIIDSQRSKSIVKNFNKGIAFEELCQKCSFKERFNNKIDSDLL